MFSKRWDIKTEKRDRRSIGTNCRGREPVFYRGRDTNTQYWNLCSTIKRWDVKTELGPVFYRKWDTKTEEGGRGFIRAAIQENKYRGREHQF